EVGACEIFQKISFNFENVNNLIYQFDQITGKLRQIPKSSIHAFTPGNVRPNQPIPIDYKIFHNLSITNFTDSQTALFHTLESFQLSKHLELQNPYRKETHVGPFGGKLPSFPWPTPSEILISLSDYYVKAYVLGMSGFHLYQAYRAVRWMMAMYRQRGARAPPELPDDNESDRSRRVCTHRRGRGRKRSV
ncbi:MAG TPA: hypothetical protein VFV08_10850, partial [Puia sp.]|nr:hypothetical protein [Puia sp.]